MHTLDLLPLEAEVYIKEIKAVDGEKRRLLDLGFVPGSKITVLYKSPSGDPTAYYIRGCIIALRCEEASKIVVTGLKEEETA